MTADRLWTYAALGLSVAAVAASLQTGLSASRHRDIVARKERDLLQIQSHVDRWTREDDYRFALDARRAWQPADLEDVAIRTLGMDTARIVLRPAVPAANGWQHREATVDIHGVSLAEAALFLSVAAETPPPWRVREIDVRSGAEAGQGAMNLVLEALEKKP